MSMPEIVELLASRVHRFEGRPSDGPLPAPDDELAAVIEVRAGLGIVGDRYHGRPAHRDASVTVIARESVAADKGLFAVRRNIMLAGFPVDDLVGKVLTLDSGDGPVALRVNSRAHPCAWMDVTVGPGAWKALRGKGGIRCTPLTDGFLRLGSVKAEVTAP
jgi:hypothetical protein